MALADHSAYPLSCVGRQIEDAGAAHQHVEENKNIGKVLLLLPTEEDTEGKQEL